MTWTLRHLNNDTSWLLSIPLTSDGESAGRAFTILIDPWFSGQQIDFFPAFSVQSHGSSRPVFDDIASLEADLVGRNLRIDVVLISYDFTDHCHRETLIQLDPEVPVFANTKEAASRLRGFKHFKRVIDIPYWQERTCQDLPGRGTMSGIDIAAKQGIDLPNDFPREVGFAYLPTLSTFDFSRLHGAALLTVEEIGQAKATALLYTPHGVPPKVVQSFLNHHADHLNFVALLHSLDVVSNPWYLGGLIASGSPGALTLARLVNPSYLVSTHDEDDKVAAGLVSLTLRRKKSPPPESLQASLRLLRTEVCVIGNGGFLSLERGL